MIGYAGWTMERATISDAIIPILADGIKWLGYSRETSDLESGCLWGHGL